MRFEVDPTAKAAMLSWDMKKLKLILILVVVSIIGIVALVEFLTAGPLPTIEEELLAAVSFLPEYEKARADPVLWEKTTRLYPYNHLASLGKAGFQLALQKLRDPSVDEKMGAYYAKALLYYPDKSLHINDIASLLADTSADVRAYGVWILGTIPREDITSPAVLELLAKKARDKSIIVRYYMGRTLARLSWGPSDKAFAALVKDTNATVARAACHWTHAIENMEEFPQTIYALVEAVRDSDNDELRGYALLSLATMGKNGLRLAKEIFPDTLCARLITDKDTQVRELACILPQYFDSPGHYKATIEAMVVTVPNLQDAISISAGARALRIFAERGAPLSAKVIEGARKLAKSPNPDLRGAGRRILEIANEKRSTATRSAK